MFTHISIVEDEKNLLKKTQPKVEEGYPSGGGAGRVGLGGEAPVSPGAIWQVLPQLPLRNGASGGARPTLRPVENTKQSDGGPLSSSTGVDVELDLCSAVQKNESPYHLVVWCVFSPAT